MDGSTIPPALPRLSGPCLALQGRAVLAHYFGLGYLLVRSALLVAFALVNG